MPRKFTVGGGDFGTANEFAAATAGLETSGGTEDGYAAINFALQQYVLDPNARTVFVLVTDEDRDNTDPSLTFQSILADLQARNIILNGILDQQITDQDGNPALGASETVTFLDAGGGQFTVSSAPLFPSADGTTFEDYTQLILDLDAGCVADLNLLRAGGDSAEAFGRALAECLTQEVAGRGGAVSPIVIVGPRDLMRTFVTSFHDQLMFRMTGRLHGPDRDLLLGIAPQEVTPLGYEAVVSGGASGSAIERLGADFGVPVLGNDIVFGKLHLFASLRGEFADYEYGHDFPDFDLDMLSGVVGVDYTPRDRTIIGVALGFGDGSVEGDFDPTDELGDDEVDGGFWSAALYGSAPIGQRGYVDAILSYADGDFDTDRVVAAGPIQGSLDGTALSAAVTAGTLHPVGRFVLNPSIEVAYSHVEIDGFTEAGDSGLVFAGHDYDMFSITPKLGASTRIQQTWGAIIPVAEVGARIWTSDHDRTVAVGLAGGTPTGVAIPDWGTVSLLTNVGVAAAFNERVTARLDYQGTFDEEFHSHAITGRVRIRLQ